MEFGLEARLAAVAHPQFLSLCLVLLDALEVVGANDACGPGVEGNVGSAGDPRRWTGLRDRGTLRAADHEASPRAGLIDNSELLPLEPAGDEGWPDITELALQSLGRRRTGEYQWTALDALGRRSKQLKAKRPDDFPAHHGHLEHFNGEPVFAHHVGDVLDRSDLIGLTRVAMRELLAEDLDVLEQGRRLKAGTAHVPPRLEAFFPAHHATAFPCFFSWLATGVMRASSAPPKSRTCFQSIDSRTVSPGSNSEVDGSSARTVAPVESSRS